MPVSTIFEYFEVTHKDNKKFKLLVSVCLKTA